MNKLIQKKLAISVLALVSVFALASGFDSKAIAEGTPAVTITGEGEGSKAGTQTPDAIAPVKLVDPHAEKKAAEQADVCLSHESAIDDIRKRREDLEIRAKELEARESELNARAKALEEELKKIESVREEIAKIEQLSNKEGEEKVAKVVETIENMNPKAASKLIATLDETLAVSAMKKVETKKLAKIMNNLEPEVSSRLTESLTGVARVKRKSTAQLDAAAVTPSRKGGE